VKRLDSKFGALKKYFPSNTMMSVLDKEPKNETFYYQSIQKYHQLQITINQSMRVNKPTKPTGTTTCTYSFAVSRVKRSISGNA
jgi:hypothetical protein